MTRGACLLSLTALLGLLAASPAVGQEKKPFEPDFSKLTEGQGVRVFNRRVSAFSDGRRNGLRVSENLGDGVAYLEGIEFATGVIEVDLRGKDAQGQSFVGVAFHGVDGTTYDAVYFRPFNFRAADSASHAHAVQYISHPTYTWSKLRAEHPGGYERKVSPAPDPNGWFHARVVVTRSNVSVFVGDATEPSLVVSLLSERTRGLVGLWVGNTSGGDFANLRIRPE